MTKPKPKKEPVLAVTFIINDIDSDDPRCVLQVYKNAKDALTGETEHLREQGFIEPSYRTKTKPNGIIVWVSGLEGQRVAQVTFFKLSQLKPGFAEKFS